MRNQNTAKIGFVLVGVCAFVFLQNSAIATPPARCFLHGVIVPTSDNTEKNPLSNMIRMNFDADNKAKCEQMLSAYCQYNVKDKNYLPSRLKGSFKPNVEKTEEITYTFTEKCKLVSDE